MNEEKVRKLIEQYAGDQEAEGGDGDSLRIYWYNEIGFKEEALRLKKERSVRYITQGLCPECHEKLLKRYQDEILQSSPPIRVYDLWCGGCDVVWERGNEQEKVPMPQTDFEKWEKINKRKFNDKPIVITE